VKETKKETKVDSTLDQSDFKVKVTLPGIFKNRKCFFDGVTLVWSKIEQKLGFLNLHSEGSKMFRYFFFFHHLTIPY